MPQATYKCPLWEFLIAHIVAEGREVLDGCKSGSVGDDRLKHHQRVVLPYVVIGKRPLIREIGSLKPCVRRVLLILAPGYALCV